MHDVDPLDASHPWTALPPLRFVAGSVPPCSQESSWVLSVSARPDRVFHRCALGRSGSLGGIHQGLIDINTI